MSRLEDHNRGVCGNDMRLGQRLDTERELDTERDRRR